MDEKPKRKRKEKPKGIPPSIRLIRQVTGCVQALLYVFTLVIFLLSLTSIGLLIWIAVLFPPFNPLVWILIAALFAYLSGYFAFADDDDDSEKPKRH